MSIFGICTVLAILYMLYFWQRDKYLSSSQWFVLLAIWFLQLTMGLLPILCIGCNSTVYTDIPYLSISAVAFLLIVFLVWKNSARKKSYLLMVLLVCISVSLMYTEYFNGVESFESTAEFRAYERPLKEHYHLLPYKVINREDQNPQEADLFYLPQLLDRFLTPTPIKIENGKLYYYKLKGIGENGLWFEFGIPEGPQLL